MQNSACQLQKACCRIWSILVETDGQIGDLLDPSHYESLGSQRKLSVQRKKEIAVNNGHMAALQTKHAELDSKIETENNRPNPDDALIHRLKKQKLHIKDILVQETAHA
jgi:uncharacterized protein